MRQRTHTPSTSQLWFYTLRSAMPTAISIRHVSKNFPLLPGAPKAPAVDDISLEIAPGELFFLLGPSGCGKTTLLRMIAGFIEPSAGAILFNSHDITALPPNKRNAGMVFQSYALWPHLTVWQNVAFGLDVRGIQPSEQEGRILEALRLVRMDAYKDRKPNQLSGGQQQRVALARSLVVRPDVLLLDEPLSNLDSKLRVELRSEIRRICKESGITTVYVTHDQKEALSMADRMAILRSGRILELGAPEELYRRPATRFVADFLGDTNLLPGRVLSSHGDQAVVEIHGGRIQAQVNWPVSTNASVTVSVRPEAWENGSPGSGLQGTVIDRVFLGEIAQFVIDLGQGTHCHVSRFSPSTQSVDWKKGDLVRLDVGPFGATLVQDD